MFELKKEFEIESCHHLNLPHASPCNGEHGHTWKIAIYCRADDETVDKNNGMIIDFSEIKRLIHGVLDHKNLNNIIIDNFPSENPTAENIAKWICLRVPHCYKVDVQETTGNIATYIDDSLAHRL